jgi:FkbM family methyltransferase
MLKNKTLKNKSKFYKKNLSITNILQNSFKTKTKSKTKTKTKFKSKTKTNLKNKYYKNNTKSIVSNTFLSKLKIWKKQEKFYSYNQGKGYGGSSILREVEICSKFMIIKPSIFIDIGSEKGNYTKEVLKYYPDIEVFMFEPSVAHKEIYKKSFEKMPNVHINQIALSNVNGKQKLYYDTPGSAFASLTKRRLDHFNINMNISEEIETMRFDEFWKTTDIYKNNPNTIIDYIKMDVEGHELWVIEGFGKLLNKIGLIQFEFGGTNIDTRTFFQDFWYFFKDKDFSIYRIAPSGIVPIIEYLETDEFFQTTNYIAVNNKINKIKNNTR